MSLGGLILSGGPDSALAAWMAVDSLRDVDWKAFHFIYGQLAVPEYDCARKQANLLGVNLETIELPSGILTSTMTSVAEDRAAEGLEPTFVPGRNAIFLTLAAARLYRRSSALVLVGGWNAVDAAGYPDCRKSFIRAQERSLHLALDSNVTIISPVIEMTKAEVIKTAVKYKIPLQYTWSCYTPVMSEDGKWSPCENCVSCELRSKGFKEAGLIDPLRWVEVENG